ncbi:MAG: hypothetical protein JXR94_00060 [Candidatus Hydrogenedentes bacterium]|nr:hypothetical protein [Candidatus Hydrogenedentota bacterium]
MLEMARVHVIRTMVNREEVSIREAARRLGVSRNTVRGYLRGEVEPGRRKETPRERPVLEAVAPRIDVLLEEWSKRTTEKQRITGSRLHRALVEEGYRVGATTVRAYLREKRLAAQEVYVPLVYAPGECVVEGFREVAVAGYDLINSQTFAFRPIELDHAHEADFRFGIRYHAWADDHQGKRWGAYAGASNRTGDRP